MRASDQRFQLIQVELHLAIVFGICIRNHLHILVFPALCPHKFAHLLICRENGSGRAHLRAHVRDSRTLCNLQTCSTLSYILKYFSKAALDANPAKHLQDNLLGVAARF